LDQSCMKERIGMVSNGHRDRRWLIQRPNLSMLMLA
jgi:hypothetical protein